MCEQKIENTLYISISRQVNQQITEFSHTSLRSYKEEYGRTWRKECQMNKQILEKTKENEVRQLM